VSETPAQRVSETPAALPQTVDVLGHAVHPVDLEQASTWCLETALGEGPPRLAVTLNPEIVVRARRDAALRAALTRADLTVADGVGVVWAARRAGRPLPGRVPGVELTFALLQRGGPRLRVALVGGRPGVAASAAAEAEHRWGVTVTSHHHGYFDRRRDTPQVAAAVAAGSPHLLLAGLGEGQEQLLDDHRQAWGATVLIGVGGSLDVLAGVARRTPAWTRRLGLEWAWRVGLDPARWHRLPRLATFAWLTLRQDRVTLREGNR